MISFVFAWVWPHCVNWLQTRYPRVTPVLPTWVSTSVSLRVCSADWLRRLVPISSMAAVWVCTAVLFISSIPERTFSWMKFSSWWESKHTLRITWGGKIWFSSWKKSYFSRRRHCSFTDSSTRCERGQLLSHLSFSPQSFMEFSIPEALLPLFHHPPFHPSVDVPQANTHLYISKGWNI